MFSFVVDELSHQTEINQFDLLTLYSKIVRFDISVDDKSKLMQVLNRIKHP
jgi:hypothetical protein